jgi:hypothetical protein
MKKMKKISLVPKSRLGIWAAGLSIAFIIFIWLKMQSVNPMSTFFIAALGLAGFFLSITAIIKNKDRAVLTLLPIPVGLIIIIWIIGEMMYPH